MYSRDISRHQSTCVQTVKARRSPRSATGVRGHAPPGNFEKLDAIICIFVYFEGHKRALWWLSFDENCLPWGSSMLDDQIKRLDRVERRTCWEENGALNLKAIFFWQRWQLIVRGVVSLFWHLHWFQVLRNWSGIQDLLSPLSFW